MVGPSSSSVFGIVKTYARPVFFSIQGKEVPDILGKVLEESSFTIEIEESGEQHISIELNI